MTSALRQAGHAVLWYLKQATGEAKWEEYLERCDRNGVTPSSRRDFERSRADHKEANPQSRCC